MLKNRIKRPQTEAEKYLIMDNKDMLWAVVTALIIVGSLALLV